MEQLAILSSTEKRTLIADYQKWQEDNPTADIKDTQCTSTFLGTGSHPGDREHSIFIFYTEKTPVEAS